MTSKERERDYCIIKYDGGGCHAKQTNGLENKFVISTFLLLNSVKYTCNKKNQPLNCKAASKYGLYGIE